MGTSARQRAVRRDPVPLVASAVALVTYVLHGFDGSLTRDLALYVYAGQQFADGVPPYEGVLNRAGPLAHMLPGLGLLGTRLLGVDDVHGLRALFLLFAVAAVASVYLMCRDLWESRWAGVAAAAAFLTFTGFIHYATNGPREKTPMVLFFALCLWAMVRRRWFAAGLLLSLSTLALQIVFFVGMPTLLVASLWSGRRVRNLALVVGGGLVPVAVLAAYFAAVGALKEALSGFLLLNLSYTVPQPLTEQLGARWQSVVDGYGASLVVLMVGLLAVVVLAISTWRGRPHEMLPARAHLVAMAVGTVGGLVWSLRDFDSWADLFPFLPIAAVGIGGLSLLVVNRLAPRVATLVSVVWVAAAVVFAMTYAVTSRDPYLPAQRAAVAAAVDMADGRPQFLTFNAPQALVLSGTRSPSRFLVVASGMDDYIGDVWPGGVSGYAADMIARRPDAIAVGDPDRRWFESALAGEYEPVAEAPGWVWYMRTPVTPAERAALEGSVSKPPDRQR